MHLPTDLSRLQELIPGYDARSRRFVLSRKLRQMIAKLPKRVQPPRLTVGTARAMSKRRFGIAALTLVLMATSLFMVDEDIRSVLLPIYSTIGVTAGLLWWCSRDSQRVPVDDLGAWY